MWQSGAMPECLNVLMLHQKDNSHFSIKSGIEFKEEDALKSIEDLMNFFWDCKKYPEVIYIQSGLPTILLYACDSTCSKAITSIEDMESFVGYLKGVHYNAANMDW